MPGKFLSFIGSWFNSGAKRGSKISYYHYSEKSTPSRTVYVQFEGQQRAVCCHGCAAILKTVEELGMCDEYRAHKIQVPQEND